MGSANLALSLAVAIAKGTLVLWFFMELKGGMGLTCAFAAAGFFWLLIMIALTWTDYRDCDDVQAPVTISSANAP